MRTIELRDSKRMHRAHLKILAQGQVHILASLDLRQSFSLQKEKETNRIFQINYINYAIEFSHCFEMNFLEKEKINSKYR